MFVTVTTATREANVIYPLDPGRNGLTGVHANRPVDRPDINDDKDYVCQSAKEIAWDRWRK